MKKFLKYLLTGAIVAVAVILVLFKYWDYVVNPWTRDGQVRAEVIQLTSRVSGPIVALPIRDNQFVKAGDLLFEIDPRTFQASLDQARAQLDETGDNVQALEKQVEVARAGVNISRESIEQAKSSIAQLRATIAKNKAEYERKKNLLPQKATSKRSVESAQAAYEVSVQKRIAAEAGLRQAQSALAESQASLAEAQAQLGAIGDANSQVRASLAALRQAELDLEFTQVKAPVDGYITNLNLRLGSQAVANQPALALVDINSYWIDGFFRENTIANIRAGDRAVVTLMTYSDRPLEGRVDSIGWGIAQQDGSTGFDLLPSISPTFDWIRLAQRVPVRIHLSDVPEDIKLRVGTTCSVLVMTDTTENGRNKAVPAAPKALQ
ncbi:MAG: HlyD family secretion protein [Desulfobacterales bacterium]